METIACYLRVSTDEQEGSIKNQLEMVKHSYKGSDIKVYSDLGTSGTKITGRDGFIQLLKDAGLKQRFLTKKKFVFIADDNKEPLFNKIVCKSPSRFARNTDCLAILKELGEKGVFVYFEDINKDTSNPEDNLILTLSLTLAQNESRETARRTKAGHLATARANKIRGNSLYGYHFDRVTNSLKIIESEAEIVRHIFDLCINGMGYRKIADTLNKEGIKPTRSRQWEMSTIKHMIHNHKYRGYNMRNTWISKHLFSENHTNVRRDKKEWIIERNERIDIIINQETWDKAHEEVAKRLTHGNKGKHISKRDTRDKVKCGVCGKPFYICHSKTIGSSINTNAYFICSAKKNNGVKACNNKNIRLDKVNNFIDSLAKNYFKNIKLKNKARLIQLRKELKNIKNKSFGEVNQEIKDLKEKIEFNEENLSKLVDKFMGSTGVMQKVIEKKMNEAEIEAEKDSKKLLELQRQINNNEGLQKDIESKIRRLQKDIEISEEIELTREQLLDKIEAIKVNRNNVIKVEYY